MNSQEHILRYSDIGMIDYNEAWELQKNLFNQRLNNEINDTLILLEHNHTYTLGKTADRNHLTSSDEYRHENGISVYEIDRGGDITYHGPGQIVGYPIIDLKNWQEDTHKYLRALEEVIILTCNDYGIEASRNPSYTGVWIENRKIAAIGIKVSRWITMHGFAFNVNTDLSFFNGIIPCGISDKEVTSLQKELKHGINIHDVKSKIVKHFVNLFNYSELIVSDQEYFTSNFLLNT